MAVISTASRNISKRCSSHTQNVGVSFLEGTLFGWLLRGTTSFGIPYFEKHPFIVPGRGTLESPAGMSVSGYTKSDSL